MDTGAILYNLRKFSFLTVFTLLIFFFTGCPSEEDCFDLGSTARVNDLIHILPEQTEYNQGDLVTLSLIIPATNSYFGNELDLFQETGDDSALLSLGFNQLFLDNNLNFLRGNNGNSENNNWYIANYNEDNEMYELEIEISLDRVGHYSFVDDGSIIIDGGHCNRFRIDTNAQWDGVGVVEFIVSE